MHLNGIKRCPVVKYCRIVSMGEDTLKKQKIIIINLWKALSWKLKLSETRISGGKERGRRIKTKKDENKSGKRSEHLSTEQWPLRLLAPSIYAPYRLNPFRCSVYRPHAVRIALSKSRYRTFVNLPIPHRYLVGGHSTQDIASLHQWSECRLLFEGSVRFTGWDCQPTQFYLIFIPLFRAMYW